MRLFERGRDGGAGFGCEFGGGKGSCEGRNFGRSKILSYKYVYLIRGETNKRKREGIGNSGRLTMIS